MDPSTLFSYERHVDSRSLRGRTLLVTLGAYSDAGDAQRLVDLTFADYGGFAKAVALLIFFIYWYALKI